jgi:hypothetical protein
MDIILVLTMVATALWVVLLFPAAMKHWRMTLMLFMMYLAFEGLVRRSFPYYHLAILVAKDFILIPIYLGAFLSRRSRSLRLTQGVDSLFTLIIVAFLALAVIQLFNPRQDAPWIARLISLKTYFWYLPLIFVAYIWGAGEKQMLRPWRLVGAVVMPVAFYGLLQAATGWDTIRDLPDDSAIVAAAREGGGFYRQGTRLQLMTVSSTLFHGRLGPFAMAWSVIGLGLLIYSVLAERRFRWYHLILFVSALVSLLIGNHRTAVLAVLAAIVLEIGYLGKRIVVGRILRVILISALVVVVGVTGVLWVLGGSDVAVSKEQIADFLSGMIIPETYDVATVNIWRGLVAAFGEVGLWGLGTGSVVPGLQYISPDAISPLSSIESESILHRLLFEFGVLGIVLYVVAFGRLAYRTLRVALKIRRSNLPVGAVIMSAFLLQVAYFVVSYKHHGFMQDPMLQTYVFVFTGYSLGLAVQLSPRGWRSTCN